MKTLITVDKAGRMVLHKSLRTSLRLHGEGKVTATVINDHVELAPALDSPVATRKAGRFLVIKSTGNQFDAVASLAEIRSDR